MPAADPYIVNRINGNTEGFFDVSDRYDPDEIEELFAVSEVEFVVGGAGAGIPYEAHDGMRTSFKTDVVTHRYSQNGICVISGSRIDIVSEEGYSWSVPFGSIDAVGHNGVWNTTTYGIIRTKTEDRFRYSLSLVVGGTVVEINSTEFELEPHRPDIEAVAESIAEFIST
ncbi:hypothetical protein [Halobaculum roseum]|uniref:Uncharacterized protein n=1 Tax=Halobaculum roseum TaxID=2175149 RepID=A0ABD5MTK9_9EURY|nr:hypothetical protein [Halobaculum roseum]QZY01685.1 hypothetical protein K6T36_10115 [Halobaculum roseum]